MTRARPWVYGVALLGLVAWLVVENWTFNGDARRAVDALYATSAYVAESEPGIVDPERARQVIGDRPVVVAVLPAGSDSLDRCRDVVAQHEDVVAVVYTGPDSPAACAGGDFPAPDDPELSVDDWVHRLTIDTEYSTRYRIDRETRDRTVEIEEFVLAFDSAVPGAYAEGLERRELAASPRVWWEVVLRLAGTVLVVVAGFVSLRVIALRVRARRMQRRAVRERRLEQLVRVARIADVLIADAPTDLRTARRRAEAAGRYVQLLAAVEAARDREQLDAVDARLAELERRLR